MASSERRALLLDVNTLMALAWPNHQFHHAVLTRLERQPVPSWATCVLTQLGFVRLSSNPAVVGVRKTLAQALRVLAALTSDREHRHLDPLPNLLEVEPHFKRLLGHQQVTDAYLLAIAATHDAVLLTLDRRLVPSSRTRRHIEVLVP